MENQYQICNRCVMDSSDVNIVFDENGICNHCKNAFKKLDKVHYFNEEKKKEDLNKVVNQIKKEVWLKHLILIPCHVN